MKIEGYCIINKNATTCKGAENPNEFIGKTCAIMSFGIDESVLVLNPQHTALAMFDKEDIYSKFKCGVINGVITPPGLSWIEQGHYVLKAQSRKGGYNHILANMVIVASLQKGEFYDIFLWQKQ